MKNKILWVALSFMFFQQNIIAQNIVVQTKQDWYPLIGSAYLDNNSYCVLERLCDEAWDRMAGSPNNEKAMQILKEELEKIDYKVKLEKFNMPGWRRGDDSLIVTSPLMRSITGVALGYVDSRPEFESNVICIKEMSEKFFKNNDVKDKVALIPSDVNMMRGEIIPMAAKYGLKCVLFVNGKKGMLTLAGTANFNGEPSPIPAYSITYEEGEWIKRLLDRSIPVKMKINTKSCCFKEMETANIVATLPGKRKEIILVTAHFDTWDSAQGGIDNGLGIAILYDTARLIKKFSPENLYTIEFVWFNAEEEGLFGSREYVEFHKNDPILAVINADMTGTPTGFNAMGFDELVPFLESLNKNLNGFDLKNGVVSKPWSGSDHMSFILKGIPSITLDATLDHDMHFYYHSTGDTFDKVNKRYLSDAVAISSILLKEVANNSELNLKRLSEKELVAMLKKHGLDKQIKAVGAWKFKED